MSVAYTLYIGEPRSRFLAEKVDPEEVERVRIEDLHTIDNLMHSLREDLADLLPPGYTVELSRELPE